MSDDKLDALIARLNDIILWLAINPSRRKETLTIAVKHADSAREAAAAIASLREELAERGTAFQTAQNETLLALRKAEAELAAAQREIQDIAYGQAQRSPPREPTEAMVKAAVQYRVVHDISYGWGDIWRAMYDAAPQTDGERK